MLYVYTSLNLLIIARINVIKFGYKVKQWPGHVLTFLYMHAYFKEHL